MIFKFILILWVNCNFSFPRKIYFTDRSFPVPQCYKTGIFTILVSPLSLFSSSWSVILAESETMVSPVRQWLAEETQFSGTARRMLASEGEPYALCHLLWGWVVMCLESHGSCSEVHRPGIPFSPRCSGPGYFKEGSWTSSISLTWELVRNAKSLASLGLLSQHHILTRSQVILDTLKFEKHCSSW